MPLIEEDMDTLKQFFYQGGDGVPMEEINSKFVEIYAILDILRLDTQTLISNLKQVLLAPSCATGQCCIWIVGLWKAQTLLIDCSAG